MTRTPMHPPSPPKVTDLLVRQKCEAMIEYAYIALRRLQGWYAHGLAPLGRIAASVQSWLAHAAHADTHGLARAVLGRFAFSRGEVRS